MQIDKICRACLREDAEMIKSENDVYQKFLFFTNLTCEDELLNIPFNLCSSCEQKLNSSSLDFKTECHNSHRVLLDRVRNTHEVKFETTDFCSTALVTNEQTNKPCLKCKYCNKNFKASSKLVVHERTHTGEKPYSCQVCGRSFSLESSLKYHMKLHNIGSWISCDVCNKKFCKPNHLLLHKRTHTGEKPCVCSECGKAFLSKSLLAQHSKTHSDLRPYQCNLCSKSFKIKSFLKYHMWRHSGETPYKCSQCSYECRHSGSLKRHMKMHNIDKPQADKPHHCLICTRTYTTQAMLTSHINTHDVSFLEI